jgi:hypothetical protein
MSHLAGCFTFNREPNVSMYFVLFVMSEALRRGRASLLSDKRLSDRT